MTTVLVTPAVVQFVVGPVTGNRYVPNGAGEITVDNADLALLQAVGFIIPTGGGAVTPPQVVGGITVGSAGVSGIYVGHTLSWGDDFVTPLDIVGPSTPKGKYFATKGYSAGPRGNNTVLSPAYDVDPLFTGHNDSNRGVPVGFNNVTQSSSLLTLGARKATVGEQANLAPTDPTINGGVRGIVSAAFHTEGAVGFYPSANSVIVEAYVKYVNSGQLGWHADIWTNSANPMNTYGAGNFDSLNASEGMSTAGISSDNRIVNGGVTSLFSSTGFFSTLYDGSFHLVSMVLQSGSWFIYIDGVLHDTLAESANFAAKPQYFLLTSHVVAGNPLGFVWNGESFSQGSWTSTGASIVVDYIRVWRPSTASHFVPLQTIPDLLVDYAGTNSMVLPSALALWGDASVTEYVQAVPCEVNEPGMSLNIISGNLIYDQFPLGVSINMGTRTLTANFSNIVGGSAGVLHCTVKAWKADGSTFVPARFSIVRGPRMIAAGGTIVVSSPATIDLYAATDVGIATPKTITVTGIPTGMVFDYTTGKATGTPTGVATASLTTTNSFGQGLTANFNFGLFQTETYALLARMATQSATTQSAIDAAIVAIKAQAGLWASIQSLVFYGLTDQAASLLNWKGDYWNPVLIGAPSWIQYQGFTSDGTSNGIDTAVNLSLLPSVNALGVSVWSNTAGQTTNGGIGNFLATATPAITGFTMNTRNASDLFQFRGNDNTVDTVASADGSGLFTGVRRAVSGANAKQIYRNGASLAAFTTASVGAYAADIGVGVSFNSTVNSFSARQWACHVIRTGNLTTADELALYNALNTLHGAVGP